MDIVSMDDIEDMELEYSENSESDKSNSDESESSDLELEHEIISTPLEPPLSSPIVTSTTASESISPSTESGQASHDISEAAQRVELTDSELRVAAAQARARSRIEAKYSRAHQIRVFQSGDFATLSLARAGIPSSTSLPRIPCRILEKIGDSYRIQTTWGILDHLQPTTVLNPLASTMDLAKRLPPQPAPPYLGPQIRTVSLNFLITQTRIEASGVTALRLYCNCRSKRSRGNKRCTTKLCQCRKAGVLCTNYCHGEQGHPLARQDDCLNLAEPRARGEAAIVEANSEVEEELSSEDRSVTSQLLQEQERHKRWQTNRNTSSYRRRSIRFASPLVAGTTGNRIEPSRHNSDLEKHRTGEIPSTMRRTRTLVSSRSTRTACTSCRTKKIKCTHSK